MDHFADEHVKDSSLILPHGEGLMGASAVPLHGELHPDTTISMECDVRNCSTSALASGTTVMMIPKPVGPIGTRVPAP